MNKLIPHLLSSLPGALAIFLDRGCKNLHEVSSRSKPNSLGVLDNKVFGQTTANFATKNKLISWLVGGLNFQIEHHLFPKISHIHYPAISKIIKETCAEYGIKYIEYRKMRHALVSHTMHLKRMGRI